MSVRNAAPPNARDERNLGIEKCSFFAFFVPKAERSRVATSGSDFRSIELFAPLAAGAAQWILISRIRPAAGGANNYYYDFFLNNVNIS
jgi:hypothetical protein